VSQILAARNSPLSLLERARKELAASLGKQQAELEARVVERGSIRWYPWADLLWRVIGAGAKISLRGGEASCPLELILGSARIPHLPARK
jgi:hypothetical protein